MISPEGQILHQSDYIYDGVGNLIQRTEAIYAKEQLERTVSTSFSYDLMNRQTEIVEAVGTPEEKRTQKQYNTAGQVIKEIKPDGVTLEYAYDELGYMSCLQSSDGTIHYTYTYDKNGNLLSSDDSNHLTYFSRVLDDDGRVLEENFNHTFTFQYSYDPLGRTKQVIFPDQSSITYSYDALRLIAVDRAGRCGNYRMQYDYCLSGRVKKATLPLNLGAISFLYDSSLRASEVSSPYYSLQVPDGGYDMRGNLTRVKVTDSLGSYAADYHYDHLNQLISESGPFSPHL